MLDLAPIKGAKKDKTISIKAVKSIKLILKLFISISYHIYQYCIIDGIIIIKEEIMARRSKKARRNTNTRHKKRRRNLYIFPYVIMALLLVGIPFSIYQIFVSSVDRSVKGLNEAIKTHDVEYIEEKTERLPIILEVLRTSYSDNAKEQEEFYESNFSNLEIQVEDVQKKGRGKEVKVKVSNVNYIDVYEKVEDVKDDQKIHDDYMLSLADPNQEQNTREATIFLKRKLGGYDINESRDFINAILGGALEYADDYDGDQNDDETDFTDQAINNDN